ncbi:MAG TPA: amidohydrolase family protein [Candidatus Limnocylindrales bacterium]
MTDDRWAVGALDALPRRGPFAVRARIVTPLGEGGTRYLPDGVLAVDASGRIAEVTDHAAWQAARHGGHDSPEPREDVIDIRPLALLPGLVDLHAHLPQLPNAGLGAGLHLLGWLERYIYPLERTFDREAAASLAPLAFERMASLGTTTVVLYGAAWAPSLDETFRAAEAHGIRLVAGRVMMDRTCYRDTPPDQRLEVELGESAELCERWHGRDEGRLSYAFTPRFAVSCTAELLRESAALAQATGAYWQTHLSEDRDELAAVARLFPAARDYVDVYDRAGGLGPRSIMAHAIHLSPREISRLAETRAVIAHCPESNLFLGSGSMPLTRYRAAGLVVGLGSDVAGGPTLSLFSVMRAGAYTHGLLRAAADADAGARSLPMAPVSPLGWLALGSVEGARALGIDGRVGSLEPGKEADMIAVDQRFTMPVPGAEAEDPEELVGRLIFRPHPEMVRAAWVRGRRLADGRRASRGADDSADTARRALVGAVANHG